MKQTLQLVGKIAFWVSWPLLYAYTWRSQRTRVVICHKDDVLVVREWYGSGQWSLPGGGCNRNESPLACACREVLEEVGIQIKTKDLRVGEPMDAQGNHGFQFRIHPYIVQVADKPQLMLQKHEISDSAWLPWRELLEGQQASANTKQVLASFFKQ